MKYWIRFALALGSVPALAACGGDDEAPEAVVAQPAGGMEGMGGMQMDGGMMEQMQAHMQSMEGANGERHQTMLPEHRQMVANMISQFNREMRGMEMGADSEWNQTIEALRQDLRQMPEMTAQELESFMPEHRQRVMRLMEMHREMMGSMQM